MRTLAGLLIGFAVAGCGPAPQEPTSRPRSPTTSDSPQLYIDQTRPEDLASYVHEQALASVAAAQKVTVAEVEAKIAAGDAETMKALEEAKEVVRREFAKWKSAMTYKFVGALEDFVATPDAGGTNAP